jgi:hypothetical protein
MSLIVIFCGFVQLLFSQEKENVFAVAVVIFGWFIANKYIIKREKITNYTFSTFLILGYVLTQFTLPLIFTLIEGKPLIYNLTLPFQVFSHSILSLITIIVAHYIYIHVSRNSARLLIHNIQKKLVSNGLFDSPTNKQLWIMGFIGIFALISKYIFYGGFHNENNESDVLGKFIEGFILFSYAPLFIPLSSLHHESYMQVKSINSFLLVLYIILLIGIGMVGNSRGLFMQGFTAMGLVYFLGLCLGKFNYKILKIKNILMGLILLWIITGPLSELGTSMVIVRNQRSSISSIELVKETLMVFQDKQIVNSFKKLALSEQIGNEWDEVYFDNIFLARFCNLKFNDLNLVQGLKIKDGDERMLNYSIDRFWAILPSPILSIFQITNDKKKVTSASFGDYLYFCNGGVNALGGFRTGHFSGTGIASFGWWYLAILGLGMIPLFLIIDFYSITYKSLGNPNVIICLAGLIQITFIFTFWGTSSASESVVSIYTYLLRGWIQSVILYYLVFKFSQRVS